VSTDRLAEVEEWLVGVHGDRQRRGRRARAAEVSQTDDLAYSPTPAVLRLEAQTVENTFHPAALRMFFVFWFHANGKGIYKC
jgi:hypothetical protein